MAVYVQFALAMNSQHMTQMSFSLDGDTNFPDFVFNHSDSGVLPTDPRVSFLYNVTVFSEESLTNTSHTLLVMIPGIPTMGNSALFDYAIYTSVLLLFLSYLKSS